MIVDRDDWHDKLQIYKTIKYSNLNKIYVCNRLLQRIEILLDTSIIEIGMRTWYREEYENIKQQIKEKMTDKCNIILTSGGMASKVLIADLMLEKEGIYIDIGSALDLIASKKDSRGYMHYDEMKQYFSDILPLDWENDKYNHIFQDAQHQFGLHLLK